MSVMRYFQLFLLLLLLIAFGCKSYNVRPDLSAEDRFSLAKRMYKNEDFFDAKNQFKIITLNNPGATFVDEAQYYLADCHLHLKEYILAADEFSRLTRLYPRSQWVDDAQFKTAYCEFKLSPKPALDQTYTVKAVESLQRFIEDYPGSDLIPEAERLLKTCRRKLAQKEYKAGALYRKLGDHNGAFVYFDSVTNHYYDTKFAEPATYWKGESLFKLKRMSEARQAFEDLLRKFPKSEFVRDAKERLVEIDNIMDKNAETPIVTPANGQTKN